MGIYPGVRLLGRPLAMLNPLNSQTLPKRLHHFLASPAAFESFSTPLSLPNRYCQFHPSGCEEVTEDPEGDHHPQGEPCELQFQKGVPPCQCYVRELLTYVDCFSSDLGSFQPVLVYCVFCSSLPFPGTPKARTWVRPLVSPISLRITHVPWFLSPLRPLHRVTYE